MEVIESINYLKNIKTEDFIKLGYVYCQEAIDTIITTYKKQQKEIEEYNIKILSNAGIYQLGFNDGQKSVEHKIKAKIEEYKWSIESYDCDEADYKQSQAVGAWNVLQSLLKEKE